MEKKPSRQRAHNLRVPVLLEEKTAIQRNAANHGQTVSGYLRNLGMHYQPKTIFDRNAVLELLKINSDLVQLGGLLKIWLTNDDAWQALGREQALPTLPELLQKIQSKQAELSESVKKI